MIALREVLGHEWGALMNGTRALTADPPSATWGPGRSTATKSQEGGSQQTPSAHTPRRVRIPAPRRVRIQSVAINGLVCGVFWAQPEAAHPAPALGSLSPLSVGRTCTLPRTERTWPG